MQRDGRVVRLELAGAMFDFAEIGELAHGVVENGLRRDSRSARLVELIHQPLLTTWQYEEWRGEYVTELNEFRRRLVVRR